MLSVSPDNICRLIQLSREFHAQEGVTIPDPSGDWARQMLASHADDASLQEFNTIIADLEPDQQQEVVALLWLGRGDYTRAEWQDAIAQAADRWNPQTAEYLIAHPLLADHLEKGLELFGHRCNE
ncbi:DUF3775 domain-containing protein [Microbulbifer marinus]|uniref:DUF3775 domain-containing protein n=1 Tax=Microbulbifer marinus TaxID=658218 RepID=A0A1H3YIQ5_9GAMM|nr:DUF3775 domain-containing protein [Microbulbifer marinus]SEA11403.1 Protein of unknown function [Microbulbifer marinus]